MLWKQACAQRKKGSQRPSPSSCADWAGAEYGRPWGPGSMTQCQGRHRPKRDSGQQVGSGCAAFWPGLTGGGAGGCRCSRSSPVQPLAAVGQNGLGTRKQCAHTHTAPAPSFPPLRPSGDSWPWHCSSFCVSPLPQEVSPAEGEGEVAGTEGRRPSHQRSSQPRTPPQAWSGLGREVVAMQR